jgi:hypothetical protein
MKEGAFTHSGLPSAWRRPLKSLLKKAPFGHSHSQAQPMPRCFDHLGASAAYPSA